MYVAEAAVHSWLQSGTCAGDPATAAASWLSCDPRSHGPPLNPARVEVVHPLRQPQCAFLRIACNAAGARVCPGSQPKAWGGGNHLLSVERPVEKAKRKAMLDESLDLSS